MKISFSLFILLLIIASAYSQSFHPDSLNIGDPAPPLYINKWIKGSPIEKFEKGKIYVIEFWATWCAPCIAMMPHLSNLARKYRRDSVVIIGIDVDAMAKKIPEKKIQTFVDSMSKQMDYKVAIEDSNLMETAWLDAFGERNNGIPNSFVVDKEGTIAWIGHPQNLEEVLYKIVNNTWNSKEALTRRNLVNRIAVLDDSINDFLNEIDTNHFPPYNIEHKDSILVLINLMIKKETVLKYAPLLELHIFDILLITNPHNAYVYGKELFEHPGFTDIYYDLIIEGIQFYSDKLNLPPEIYELGAEAYQIEIDRYEMFGNMNIPKDYSKMADMYWRAKNKNKAIECMQKAIESLKNKKDFLATDLAAFESQLQLYKSM